MDIRKKTISVKLQLIIYEEFCPASLLGLKMKIILSKARLEEFIRLRLVKL